MRLIDADKFIDYIGAGHLRGQFTVCFSERNLVDMINKQPTIEQPKWISCAERLPENDYDLVHHFKERRRYLVCLSNGTTRIATFGYKEYGWWIDSHGSVLDKKRFTGVEYYLPLDVLIEPPKGDE